MTPELLAVPLFIVTFPGAIRVRLLSLTLVIPRPCSGRGVLHAHNFDNVFAHSALADEVASGAAHA